MLTDIKGFSSRTAGQSRAGTVALIKKHRELVLPVMEKFGGTLIKSIGDAFLATFDSPTDAVLCGLAVQAELGTHNAGCAPQDSIELRIAVNSGEVSVADDGDIYGDAVNATARLEGMTEAGEVCITEAVYLTMNRNEAGFEDLGYHTFRGLPEKVRVYRVLSEKGRFIPARSGGAAGETAGPDQEADLAEARRLFEEGLLRYFNNFDFAGAINALREAADIRPEFLEARLLLGVIARNIGDDVLVASTVAELKRLRQGLADTEKDRADIALGRFEQNPSWSKLVANYARRRPNDILVALAQALNPDRSIKMSKEGFEKVRLAYPAIEDIFLREREAEHEYHINHNVDKCAEILEGLMLRKPDSVNLRLSYLLLLLDTGRLEKAALHLDEALKLSPANEHLLMLSGKLAFLRKDMNAWFKIIARQIGMTKHDDSFKSELYYKWYLACAEAGREAEAAKHLGLARKYGPEWGWRTLEEIRSDMADFSIADGLFGLPRPVLDVIADHAVSLNHTHIRKNWIFTKNGIIFKVYLPEASGRECRWIQIWAQYNMSLGNIQKFSFFIDSIPVSAVFNQDGDVLKSDFSDAGTGSGGYSALITYEKPLAKNRLEFLAMEFGSDKLLRTKDGTGTGFKIEEVPKTGGTRCHMIIVPDGMQAVPVSSRPDETLEIPGFKIYVYTRFLYACQKFQLDFDLISA